MSINWWMECGISIQWHRFLAIKRNKLPICAAIWKNLKNIMPSESQTQKTICCMIWLIFPERSHLWEIANQSLHKSGSGDWPQSGQKEFWLWWGGVKNILKWHCGGLHNSKNLLKNYWTVHLQRVNFIICKVYLNKDVKTTTTTKTK